MRYFIYILGWLPLVITAMPVVDTGTWWIRILIFPEYKLQYSVCCFGCWLYYF